MATTRLNLQEFPGSAHARELGRDRVRLRFEPGLEQAYQRHHLLRLHSRIRHFTNIVLVLAIAFSFEKLARDGDWTLAVALHFGVLIPLAVALMALVLSRHYLSWFGPAMHFIAPVLGALIVFLAADSMTRGAAEDLAVPVLLQVSIFMFMGLLFWSALATSIFVLFIFVLSAIFVGLPWPLLLKCVVIVAAAAGLAAKIGRETELEQRRRFLEGELISRLVDRDGLTGLQNRRAFDERLESLWQQGMREERPIALLFIDVDHFKDYNDHYGHQAGDDTLRQIAGVLRRFPQRPLDIAARYGGEEFALVLYGASSAGTREVADRLRADIKALGIANRASGCVAVITASIGAVCVTPTPGRSSAGAVQLADEALYKAKAGGRNRIVMADAADYASLRTGEFDRADPRTA